MALKDIAYDIRKLTLGRNFTFKEFMHFVGQGKKDAASLLNLLVMDCHVEHIGGDKYKIAHGDARKNLIESRIELCKVKIDGWHELYKHLKTL